MQRKIFLFLVVSLAVWLPQSRALDIVNIDSPKIRLAISPGQSERGVIRLTNPTNQPKEIRVYVEDWYYLFPFDGSKEFKPAGSFQHSSAGWIQFLPKEFVLPPYGSQVVSYEITVPSDAEGGKVAALFFEEQFAEADTSSSGVGVGVAVRVASLFYIDVKGRINRQARVENLNLTNRRGSLAIEADFINTGNTDITAGGTFYIIDSEGVVYGRGEFNDVYTLGGDTARLSAEAYNALGAGIYDMIITLKYQDETVKVVEKRINVSRSGGIEVVEE